MKTRISLVKMKDDLFVIQNPFVPGLHWLRRRSSEVDSQTQTAGGIDHTKATVAKDSEGLKAYLGERERLVVKKGIVLPRPSRLV